MSKRRVAFQVEKENHQALETVPILGITVVNKQNLAQG